MFKFISFITFLLILSSCSNSSKEIEVKKTETEEFVPNVIPNKVLTLDITGMECEMACGGSIRKSLIETGAVSRVQFVAFDMNNETNSTKVYFDDSKITQEKIISIINKLNKNQFLVSSAEINDYSDGSVDEIKKTSSLDIQKPSAEVSSRIIEIPNLLDIIRSIIMN